MKRQTQTQIIQSLAEALAWFEKEVSWNVPLGELNHLTGRIGELYAAMITRGQMADRTNQRGYDIVTAEGAKVSVKTITTSTHVDFRKSTLHECDSVLVLRLTVDDGIASIEEVFEGSINETKAVLRELPDKWQLNTYQRKTQSSDSRNIPTARSCQYGRFRIVQKKNLTIVVEENGIETSPALPILRKLSGEIGVDEFNGNGNPKNTRTLGRDIIEKLLSNEKLGT